MSWFDATRVIHASVAALALISFAGAFFINYAASVGLFLLAGFGLVIGLRSGFLRYLGRRELLYGSILWAVFLVAVLTYAVGSQTSTGFHMLGRVLRFVLFLPFVAALVWSGLQQKHIAFAVCMGTVGTLALGVWQSLHGNTPVGITGAHIVYGDGVLLLGALGAVLSIRCPDMSRKVAYALAVLSMTSSVAASLLSGARGGWIAIPFLVLLMVLQIGRPKLRWLGIAVLVGIAAILFAVPRIRHVVVGRTADAKQHYLLYSQGVSAWSQRCPNKVATLDAMLQVADLRGAGAKVSVIPVRVPVRTGDVAAACSGGHAIQFTRGSGRNGPAVLSLYRSGKHSGTQTLAVLVKGIGVVRAGWTGAQTKVSAHGFSRVLVSNKGSAGMPLQMLVWPGQNLEVIPLQRYPGEYMGALTRSSEGNRFIMWRAALGMYLRQPFLGHGFGSFEAAVKHLIKTGGVSPSVKGFEHPHNTYLNWMYGSGTLGLIVLLLMIFCPFFVFPKGSPARAGAAVLVAGVALCGITESLFVHSLWITWYMIAMGMLMAIESQSRRRVSVRESMNFPSFPRKRKSNRWNVPGFRLRGNDEKKID